MNTTRDNFTNSDYTFNQYVEDIPTISTKKQHLISIQKCVAVLTSGFVIKNRNAYRINYTVIKRSNMQEYFGRLIFYTNEEGERKSITLKNYIELNETKLALYDRTSLLSSDPKCLSVFRPPNGIYIDGLPEYIISEFEKRVYNREALHELLSSHAYRFRHQDTFIEKLFIHYSPSGKTGKSMLASIIALMYGSLANPAVKIQEIKSDFAGWTQDFLMLHIEELQNSEYRNHDFETIIKQLTTRNSSHTKKFQDTTVGQNTAIPGFNTNQHDMYGLIRADEPTKERLVILHFKPVDSYDWNVFKAHIGLDDKQSNYAQSCANIGYSLYTYLKDTYDIKDNFNTCRYYAQEKYDLISELTTKCKNTIDNWFYNLRSVDDMAVATHFRKLEFKSIKRIPYVIIKDKQSDIEASYNSSINGKTGFKYTSIKENLLNKGFNQIKSNGYHYLRIEQTKYDELMLLADTTDGDCEEIQFDDDDYILDD